MRYLSLAVLALLSTGCQTFSTSQTSQPEAINAKSQVDNYSADLLAITTPDSLAYKQTSLTKNIAPRKIIDDSNLWHRLQGDLKLEFVTPPKSDVKHIEELATFQTRNPKLVNKIFDRAQPYLHHIVDSIEQRDLPGELAMIPLVESKFNPHAYSHSKAAGLWQFIPMTAKRFKLSDNWWIDERRDIVASTNAALDYLVYLNKFFDGDWLLAMAAYNGGEGTVQRAMRKNKKLGRPTDFWSLDLPKETREYVPKILSWAKVIRQPETYKVTLKKIANEPHFIAVDMGSQIKLEEVAKLAKMPVEELSYLNPAYKRGTIDPKPPHRVLVPASKASSVQKGLATLSLTQRANWQHYKIKAGDSLGLIAKKFGISINAIKVANNLASTRIRAGKTLVIPTPAKTKEYALND